MWIPACGMQAQTLGGSPHGLLILPLLFLPSTCLSCESIDVVCFLLQLALYSEAPATSGLSQAQVEAWQAERGIAVAGCATRPVLQFTHAGESDSVHRLQP